MSATSSPTAQQSSSSASVTNPQLTSTSTNIITKSQHGPSTALIAVIAVIGILVVAAIIGGLLYYLRKRRQSKKHLEALQNPRTDGERSHAGDAPDQNTFPSASDRTTQFRMNTIPEWNNAVGEGGIELESISRPAHSVSSFSGTTVTPRNFHELSN